jgi:hypothetical protein
MSNPPKHCTVCWMYTASSRRELEQHRAKCTGISLKCTVCPKRFSSLGTYRQHVYRHGIRARPPGDKCEWCDFVGKSYYDAEQHLRFCHAPESLRYPCGHAGCDFVGTSARETGRHRGRTHGDPTPFRCTEMRTTTTVESSALPSPQPPCAYQSKGYSMLEDHVRSMHTLETPYACSEPGCGYRSASKRAVVLHETNHARVPTYQCDDCEFITHRPDYLRQHAANHRPATTRPAASSSSSSVMIRCCECDYVATKRATLRAHVRNRHPTAGKRACGTPGCDFSSVFADVVERHAVQRHGAVPQ